MDYALPAFAAFIALGSVVLSPRAESEGAFYQGLAANGRQPGLLSLTFSQVTTWTIIGFSAVTLLYSMLGGLCASLRTDVSQMVIFLGTLILLIALVVGSQAVQLQDLWFKPFVIDQPGPILMLVALLQIWSYPMHDPVMMDRGFLADRETTRKSFLHAAWISVICIVAFGCLGVLAGAHAVKGASMNETLMQMLGTVPMLLFSAVAVSGTASLYLAPVIFFSLWGKRRDIPLWSYLLSFVLALAAAGLYFTDSSGYSQLLGEAHKYTKLLWLTVAVMGLGCLGFWLGGWMKRGDETA
jgi:hypothetical protein